MFAVIKKIVEPAPFNGCGMVANSGRVSFLNPPALEITCLPSNQLVFLIVKGVV